jgi:hypothetical protein
MRQVFTESSNLFRAAIAVLLCGACTITCGAGAGPTFAPDLSLNQIQIIGTHNSYHAGLTPAEDAWIARRDPHEAAALDYRHAALSAQLQAGMRELEIDVYADPSGGRFSRFAIQSQLAAAQIPDAPSPYPPALLEKPGFKVMHKPKTDFRSNCQPFAECLREVEHWSAAHPHHIPVYMFIETKDGQDLTKAESDELDSEVRSVIPRRQLFVPDDLLRGHSSLRAAVAADGWPPLDQVRGKLVFLLSRPEVTAVYESGHPNLGGRVFFVNGPLEDPDTVFHVLPDPSDPLIPKLVRSGLLIYTRADVDTAQGRSGSVARRNAAFASGAQIISTDYPASEPASWSGYTVDFPNHAIARCDPVDTTASCSLRQSSR